ncbi:MAG TPA: GntR family transcriptional regulator [Papillibacter sp.]|jgi:GntR family transcriptional regulator|nr:GntR family transcriptional regulator [Papillibacter sp.]
MTDRPLYIQIADQLRQKILAGEYKSNENLPSENELASRFKTSRVTVRKSLALLRRDGFIKPHHGKGHFVLPPRNTRFTLYFEEQANQGQYRILEVAIHPAAADIARMLEVEAGQLVIATRRVLEREGKPVVYDEKFIPYERGVPSIELGLQYAEFPDMFNKRFVPMSLHTEMTIGVETAPDYVCASLLLPACTALLVVERLIRTQEKKPVGYGRQYLTGEYGKLKAQSGYYTTEKF